MEKEFEFVSEYNPSGDQPLAIKKLIEGINSKKRAQVLLGVTGSGKTFTMANVINQIKKPTLILSHNKTLAAQLYEEFKGFFPNNAVEYFVSYYDYYQPEAYIARTDTYIEKDLAINDQIDLMRIRATRSLLERRDVIVVSSVSCIYGLGMPQNYLDMRQEIFRGQRIDRNAFLIRLVNMQYERREDLGRSCFRVRGDTVDIVPAYENDLAIRVCFFGDEIDFIAQIDPLTSKQIEVINRAVIYPASHHVVPQESIESAIESIKQELSEREKFFDENGMILYKERISQRTKYDIEMLLQAGYCKGIENYSRHFDKRQKGTPPSCLLDYFPKDFLMIVDESHQTIPQIRAMFNGDRARKDALVSFGFRLPSAYDNRPLNFDEFYKKISQVVYVSATPGKWEVEDSKGEITEQIIRPTGLLDPQIEIVSSKNQVDDVIKRVQEQIIKGSRVLITTLTKKLAEELSQYLKNISIKSEYLHSEIDTVDRVAILSKLRAGDCDVLVGINLLREGLDLPEVGLVAVLDADKEGFLRSYTSLIQICGRAARNVNGRVVMYADNITGSIKQTLDETTRRRQLQLEYNQRNNITPTSTKRKMGVFEFMSNKLELDNIDQLSDIKEVKALFAKYEDLMKKASKKRMFEDAAKYRDMMRTYQSIIMKLS